MLAFTREKLISHLLQIPPLVDLYQNHDPLFAERVVDWLSELEESLGQMRLPTAGMAASERALILAIADGYRDQEIEVSSRRPRKAKQAAAALAINRMQSELRRRIEEIDEQFDAWRERMAQFIAVAINSNHIPLPPTEPRNAWLSNIWKSWGSNGETQSMYNYLNAAMTQGDRIFLLDELISNILDE